MLATCENLQGAKIRKVRKFAGCENLQPVKFAKESKLHKGKLVLNHKIKKQGESLTGAGNLRKFAGCENSQPAKFAGCQILQPPKFR